ncbi:MAG: 16S rRNA (guanine(527)-N(7))-methyltransferase RsmG [Bacteroidales bacterium]|nr:16S rRNA (guanine(527)-N(7))-methyltransferase RsmG [Bacteroidales bacterium]
MDGRARLRLEQGLAQLSLALDGGQVDRLLAYLSLLAKWNRAYNLTAVSDPLDMVSLHLLDSLSILPWLVGERFIDVGTGPGLPGIPLAIALPDRHFTLLDSNGKRVRFLFQVRTALGLDNVDEVQARAESHRPPQPFDGVISRAYSAIDTMIASTAHLLAPGGHFYAMKGRFPGEELSALTKPYIVTGTHRLQVPGIDGERHLIAIGTAPGAPP